METVIAVGMMLICAGPVSVVVYTAGRAVAGIHRAAATHGAVICGERRIRETIESVCVPYWERDDRGVDIVRELLEAEDRPGYEVNLEPLLDGDGVVRGVRYRYRIGTGEYENSALFGSEPVMGKVR
jgi:hypothetical protein